MHPEADLAPHLLRDVLPRDEVWLAEERGQPIAVFALGGPDSPEDLPAVGRDVLGQVAVDPGVQGRGLGGAIVERALALRPDGLDLWVYTSNTRARALYRRHGFEVVGGTSSRNEEGVPDLLMRWRP